MDMCRPDLLASQSFADPTETISQSGVFLGRRPRTMAKYSISISQHGDVLELLEYNIDRLHMCGVESSSKGRQEVFLLRRAKKGFDRSRGCVDAGPKFEKQICR